MNKHLIILQEKLKTEWLKAKVRFAELATRERYMVLGGALFLGVMILYLLWSSLLEGVDNKRKQLQAAKKTLQEMQLMDKKMKGVAGHEKNHPHRSLLSPVALLSFLQKKINENPLKGQLKQLKQANNDSVEVQFQAVPFDALIIFLTGIVKEKNITIANFSAKRSVSPGIVDANIILKIK